MRWLERQKRSGSDCGDKKEGDEWGLKTFGKDCHAKKK
jgi:hypothetical protein